MGSTSCCLVSKQKQIEKCADTAEISNIRRKDFNKRFLGKKIDNSLTLNDSKFIGICEKSNQIDYDKKNYLKNELSSKKKKLSIEIVQNNYDYKENLSNNNNSYNKSKEKINNRKDKGSPNLDFIKFGYSNETFTYRENDKNSEFSLNFHVKEKNNDYLDINKSSINEIKENSSDELFLKSSDEVSKKRILTQAENKDKKNNYFLVETSSQDEEETNQQKNLNSKLKKVENGLQNKSGKKENFLNQSTKISSEKFSLDNDLNKRKLSNLSNKNILSTRSISLKNINSNNNYFQIQKNKVNNSLVLMSKNTEFSETDNEKSINLSNKKISNIDKVKNTIIFELVEKQVKKMNYNNINQLYKNKISKDEKIKSNRPPTYSSKKEIPIDKKIDLKQISTSIIRKPIKPSNSIIGNPLNSSFSGIVKPVKNADRSNSNANKSMYLNNTIKQRNDSYAKSKNLNEKLQSIVKKTVIVNNNIKSKSPSISKVTSIKN